jgi:DNA-directed RNA polymerase specialized sigma24 family protein
MANTTDEDFSAFFKAQWPRLVAALATVVPKGEDPSDLAQEAMTRAYADWARVQRHPRPDAWLFLTAYRLAISSRRRSRVRGRYQNVAMPRLLMASVGAQLPPAAKSYEPTART